MTFSQPIHIGFTKHELSELSVYKTHYIKLQSHFGESNLKSQYMDTDSLGISFETDDLVPDLKKLQVKYGMFDFSNIQNHPELYDETNKKVVSEYKIETSKSLDIDGFAAFTAKA